MIDILQIRTKDGVTFKAMTQKAVDWMSNYFGTPTEQYTYVYPEGPALGGRAKPANEGQVKTGQRRAHSGH